MKIYVLLAMFDGCPASFLNDPEAMKAVLHAAVEAGPFTLKEAVVVRFQPQGVTACAVVGESHLALHSWPEEGRLFFDVASCSSLESTHRALDALARALPAGRILLRDERILDPSAAC